MILLALLFFMVSFTACASDIDGKERTDALGDIFREATPEAQRDSGDDAWQSFLEGFAQRDGDAADGKRRKSVLDDDDKTNSPSFPPGQPWQTPPVPDRAHTPQPTHARIDLRKLRTLLDKLNRAHDRQGARLNGLTKLVESMNTRSENGSDRDAANSSGSESNGEDS